jgi:hypothetical protein
MEPTNKPVCGQTYSRRLGSKTFICLEPAHPNRPDAHHFVAAPKHVVKRGHLIVIPGERR